jgi:hypothetical protein
MHHAPATSNTATDQRIWSRISRIPSIIIKSTHPLSHPRTRLVAGRRTVSGWLLHNLSPFFFPTTTCGFGTDLPSLQLLRMAAIYPLPPLKITTSSSLPSGPAKDAVSR